MRPLVLVHGLWNTSQVFDPLISKLDQINLPLLRPSLPHGCGKVALFALAQSLEHAISDKWGSDVVIDLLGFSMGGLIGRIWLQFLGGSNRTSRFISVGCPHFGTYSAQLMPPRPFAGIADMKRNSHLLNKLNRDLSSLRNVECCSYFCRWDLMVLPGWQAVMPFGEKHSIPVITHRHLITHPVAIQILSEKILGNSFI